HPLGLADRGARARHDRRAGDARGAARAGRRIPPPLRCPVPRRAAGARPRVTAGRKPPRRRGAADRARIAVLAFLARWLYGLVHATIRPVIPDDETREIYAAFERDERVIVAFWHGQLAMVQKPYRGRAAGICVQVSRHGDGEIIARAVRAHGIRA